MLLNNYSFKEEADTERVHNELPSNYRSWLEFYDDIPAEHKEAREVRMTYEGAEYYSRGVKPKEYIIQREYLLARVAEELLPLRIPTDQVHVLRRAVQMGYSVSPDVGNVGPLFEKLFAAAEHENR